jgi:ATP-dependent helicase YprA (DUF1998 family)
MSTVNETFHELRSVLSDYIEAAYHISDPSIVAQRIALLDSVGTIFQSPYIESTPRYCSGSKFEDIPSLPESAREAFVKFSTSSGEQKALLFDPPYTHQEEAISGVLRDQRNLMIMTGTGSGKTESFLLPILGKLSIEAANKPKQFATYQAVRAMILYPMNALVNDQLGRLRLLFGDERVRTHFQTTGGRPARFARYTSRTPYAGVRSRKKDARSLNSIGEFFVKLQKAAELDGNEQAQHLIEILKSKGRWPAKEDLAKWYGDDGSAWSDKSGNWLRAVLGKNDVELITRHEVQSAPPDLLITNYSMLEYMMMRPIERPIFDGTRKWLKDNPDEKFLIVLDEAHLYKGAQGAEVGLLLRRLRERVGVPVERFQVICATASFNEAGKKSPQEFGSELTGVPSSSFKNIFGNLAFRHPSNSGSLADVEALCSINVDQFYLDDQVLQSSALDEFLKFRKQEITDGIQDTLYHAIENYAPFNLLVNNSMERASTIAELSGLLFPECDKAAAIQATSNLLVIGSAARRRADNVSLLPARLHAFFRGLPGLWACMDPQCTKKEGTSPPGPIGKLYSQPRETCGCGSPVLEYYTCRLCGVSYARAYTNNIDERTYLWSEKGTRISFEGESYEAFEPLDMLLSEPAQDNMGVAATYDIATGRLNPEKTSDKSRIVYLTPTLFSFQEDDEDGQTNSRPGQFTPCGCCGLRGPYGASSVQDHQTKGDQPFQALLSAQIRVQPPSLKPATNFAPMRGRKSLIFSDSRQVAARLAPRLQSYSLRDAVRALLPMGAQTLSTSQVWQQKFTLQQSFLAVMLAAHLGKVRVRPALNAEEFLPAFDLPPGEMPQAMELLTMATEKCPANLLSDLLATLTDKNFGLEALAIASLKEEEGLTENVENLPELPGVAETAEEKREIVRAWVRCWRKPGIVFSETPQSWFGTKVNSHKGAFRPFESHVSHTKPSRTIFKKHWLPKLIEWFTKQNLEGGRFIRADKLSLEFEGEWQRCKSCTSVHRPLTKVDNCVDCGSQDVQQFDPNTDPVFSARRGFYRDPVQRAMQGDVSLVSSLIAAEHTAQLNSSGGNEAFSKAEMHELRFQDINTNWEIANSHDTAVDILSSTTTMEVGIDIGELSGVALRNMPPSRSNYQQRSGRAGRRGSSVASVIAFGSVDSHDEHYFSKPENMIRGPVTDPSLALDNPDIACRHIRAFLLQQYHQDRISGDQDNPNSNLFSVLGSVNDFKNGTGCLNREDFEEWLTENQAGLALSVSDWLPTQLPDVKRQALIDDMIEDILGSIDKAIGCESVEKETESAEAEAETLPPDLDPDDDIIHDQAVGDEDQTIVDTELDLDDLGSDKFLERLLYHGVLPRYAFPTDVATFHIFNRSLSTPFRHVMSYSPQQGLNVALSQYAPNKQIWVDGSQYISKAIYSPHKDERTNAWKRKKLYFECTNCGYAVTENYSDERKGVIESCQACLQTDTFGPGRQWFRPVGFAHPINQAPITAQDSQLDTARATRAKLIKTSPGPDAGWTLIGDRIRAFKERTHLLVSNTGPDNDGYNYCSSCGRIEAKKVGLGEEHLREDLFAPHSHPYPTKTSEHCPGNFTASGVVLGTEFITDLALFSFSVDMPFRLPPGSDETRVALRTLAEAMASAAAIILEMEPGEVIAEYRPALNQSGADGQEIEIFLYDTLSGGAGFSPQLVDRCDELIHATRQVLSECPSGCDSSCYRCLQSYRNKFEHSQLDRFLALQLIDHCLSGGIPDYAPIRSKTSASKLIAELTRQFSDRFEFQQNHKIDVAGIEVEIPIFAKRISTGAVTYLTLSSPIADSVPHMQTQRDAQDKHGIEFECINEMLVRHHLPAAVRNVNSKLK